MPLIVLVILQEKTDVMTIVSRSRIAWWPVNSCSLQPGRVVLVFHMSSRDAVQLVQATTKKAARNR